jgi:hypothetical protein
MKRMHTDNTFENTTGHGQSGLVGRCISAVFIIFICGENLFFPAMKS